MHPQKIVNEWLNAPIDPCDKTTLLKGDFDINAFSSSLNFGTGGIRSICGLGSNRLNKYTVQLAALAAGTYLQAFDEPSIIIGYDGRSTSKEFSEIIANTLTSQGVKCTVTHRVAPTPFVSYLVRHTHADAGIMITASHNPKEYNGLKVYGKNGGQMVSPTDESIINIYNSLSIQDYNNNIQQQHYRYTTEEDIDGFIQSFASLRSYLHLKPISIVYTPLHGVGTHYMNKALSSWGFSNITLVSQQSEVDPLFSTVESPNPENKEALTLGLQLLESTKSDLLLASDPDADRVGVAVMHNGSAHTLSGNEMGELLTDYLLSSKSYNETPLIISTFVSSRLIKEITKGNRGVYKDVLTGFKYIALEIDASLKQSQSFCLGCEESYGYLPYPHVRDKDSFSTSCLIAEMVSMYKDKGMTLFDARNLLYKKYGVYRSLQTTITFQNSSNTQLIKGKMSLLRSLNKSVEESLDIFHSIDFLKETSHTADMICFEIKHGYTLYIRPSGTEPKIKIYCHYNTIFEDETSVVEADCKITTLLASWKEFLLTL